MDLDIRAWTAGPYRRGTARTKTSACAETSLRVAIDRLLRADLGTLVRSIDALARVLGLDCRCVAAPNPRNAEFVGEDAQEASEFFSAAFERLPPASNHRARINHVVAGALRFRAQHRVE